MKKYTAYLVLSAVLLAAGLLAIVASFAVNFLPQALTNPLPTLAGSLVLFGAGYVALYGQGRAFEAAGSAQRLAYQYARRN